MSKVGGSLPSWYWPSGIPRRVPVPQFTLDKMLARQFAPPIADRLALWSARGELTYGDLHARVTALAGGMQAVEMPQTVAVVEADPARGLVLLLAALHADRRALLVDPERSPEALGALLAQAQAPVVVTATGAASAAGLPGVRVVGAEELSGSFTPVKRPRRGTDPALLLASPAGAVVHSHFSVSSMYTSLASFIPQLRQLSFVCTRPIASWEEVSGVFGALSAGTSVACLPDAARDLPQPAAGRSRPDAADSSDGLPKDAYAILRREEIDGCLRAGASPGFLSRLRYLFVSTGPFGSRWRRGLERLLGRPVFPIWGAPEFGPAVAPHPTWFPRQAHGFPLVNVSLVPLDPATGQMCIVPWEMLERAEAAVETLSAMVGYAEPGGNAAVRVGKMLRSRQIVSIDHVGLVVLHGRSGEADRGS